MFLICIVSAVNVSALCSCFFFFFFFNDVFPPQTEIVWVTAGRVHLSALILKSRSTSTHSKSDATWTTVAQPSVLGQMRSKLLFLSLQGFISGPVSVSLCSHFLVPQSSLCPSELCLSPLGDWSEHNSVCVQRETISAVYVSVCFTLGLIGVCTHVKGAGVQGLYWTNSLTNHVSERGQDQTRYKEDKKNTEI